MKYKLYPPFLIVPEEEDFSDAWESFSYKLLCLEQSQNNIHRRNPPEQGVDLFDDTDKIAYQCKSVESGKSGDFNVTQAINSLKSALEIKEELGWEKYVLCVNVNVTGSSEKKLKEVYPEIILKSKNYWEILCEKHDDKVERNFNILVEIPSGKLLKTIEENFIDHYSEKLKILIENESIDLYLFSNRYDSIYKMKVSPDFTINDLLEIIRKFFKLPESKDFVSDGIRVSLSHSIVLNKRKQPISKTLKEIGIEQGDVITYWTEIIWKDKFELRSDVMYDMTTDMLFSTERKNRAIMHFKKELRERFISINRELEFELPSE